MGPRTRIGLATAIGYALGQIPSADLISKAVDRDTSIRDVGSGNPGALNVANSIGKQAGTAVMVADIAKAFVAGRIGQRLAGSAGANAASSAAVVGHCYPAINGFDGGKGVAASVGQVLATFPPYLPIDFGVAAAAAANPKLKHRTFVANSAASVVWIASAVLWWRKRLPNWWGPTPDVALPIGAIVSSAAIAKRFLDEGAPS